jgi:hypothetical protein
MDRCSAEFLRSRLVFNHFSVLIAALAVVGPQGAIDVCSGSAVSQSLSDAARLLSNRLGASSGLPPGSDVRAAV